MLTVEGTNSGDNDDVSLTFTDPTHFVINNGDTATTYSTQNNNGFVYNGPTDGFSKLVIDDTMGTYTVTQSLTGTHLQGDGFSSGLKQRFQSLHLWKQQLDGDGERSDGKW